MLWRRGRMSADQEKQPRIKALAPRAGFEPATIRLTVECSTAELPRNRRNRVRARQRITKPSRLAKDQICTPLSAEKGGTCCHSSNSAAAERGGIAGRSLRTRAAD